MQFSIGVEYALHSLFYMMYLPENKSLGIKQIANLHNTTDSYLSKIFTKLRKAGIVKSITGLKGGYELSKPASDISFWDVIEAIEGSSYFFQCGEIRKKNIFVKDPSEFKANSPCLIKVVIHDAEDLLSNELKSKSLLRLFEQVKDDFSEDKKEKITHWVNSSTLIAKPRKINLQK